jgi:hypothetical protein
MDRIRSVLPPISRMLMNRRSQYLLAMAVVLVGSSVLLNWRSRLSNRLSRFDEKLHVGVHRNPIEFDIQNAIRETETTQLISIDAFLALVSPSKEVVEQAIQLIDGHWHPGAPTMMLESLRFAEHAETSSLVLDLLQRKTNETAAMEQADWLPWIWNRRYRPHPQYAQFKRGLYATVDARFSEYFAQTDNAQIRLDEIVWGNVSRDGIPPLNGPLMVAAEEATYLDDDNVVFGVSINGDHRCYPKRILAWHEMFQETIGGVPICGVY